jgi:sporulation protein YlmC with PRC-barrel domain
MTYETVERSEADYSEDRSDLIASDRVEGTAVYARNGDRLGTIKNFMVGKRSGQVEYAVMSFGGFLGIGDDHYPLPWDQLSYQPDFGGYVVDVTKEQLKDAPHYGASDAPTYDDDYNTRVRGYYGLGM